MDRTIQRRAPRHVAAACVALVLAGAFGAARGAACSVDVFQAYQTAKGRGWAFFCIPGPGLSGGFVVYPGQNVGCAFRNPPVPVPGSSGDAQFFERTPAGPGFFKGWSLGTVEFSGAQWQPQANPKARILARAIGLNRPNHVYNFRLTKLVLKKADGVCSKAIEEAF
jgi:hypothetical protein